MRVHDLQAPKNSGSYLAYPPLEKAGQLLRENRLALGALQLEILGRPIALLRSLAQSAVLDAARKYLSAADEPFLDHPSKTIILAGHQPELFHPGVWIKNFALNGLARAHEAIPLNLVVDNDNAKTTFLSLPAQKHIAQLPFDRRQSEVPYEERRVQDEKLFRDLPLAAAPISADWPFTPFLQDFWEEVCKQGDRTPLLGERFAASRRSVERSWHCSNLEVPLSMVCDTEAFAWFACHLLEELPRFWEAYNAVVQAYRKQYGMRSRHHPVPDLAREGDWLEAPLWAWRSGSMRRGRLLVRRSTNGFELRSGSETLPTVRFGSQPQDLIAQWQTLREAGYKVRSRALTTTLFARLFLGDIFLHGLGGGKYDELTDAIMRDFYNIEPPAYLVLTGTLHLPFPQLPVSEEDTRRLHTKERDLWWNPQRHVQSSSIQAERLKESKNDLINQPVASAQEKRDRFQKLRKLTEDLRPFVKEEENQTRQALDRKTDELRIQQIQSRRDYAFCLFPEEILKPFCQRFLTVGLRGQ